MSNFYLKFLLLIILAAPILGLAAVEPSVLERFLGGRFQSMPDEPSAPMVPPEEPEPEPDSDPCSVSAAPVTLSIASQQGEATVVPNDLDVRGTGTFDFLKTRNSVGIGRNFLAVTGPLFGIRVGGADMNGAAAGPNDVSITENGDITFTGAVTAQAFNTIGSIEVKDDTITGDNGVINFKVSDPKRGVFTSPNTMTITADKRVGIGTANPQSSLHIAVDEISSGIRVQKFGDNEDFAVLSIRDSKGEEIGYINSNPNGRLLLGGTKGGTGFISFMTRTSRSLLRERMRIANDGKVGIGTEKPATELDVNGSITAKKAILNTICLPIVNGASNGKIICFNGLCQLKTGEYAFCRSMQFQ